MRRASPPFGAQLTQPASIVRLYPFLREAPLVVVAEDVDQLEYDPVAVRGKGAHGRVRELTDERSADRRSTRDVVAFDDDDPAADGQVIEGGSQ
jgi:hypothetical protein